jgi:tetratricopeptide (TPR) repeat protein
MLKLAELPDQRGTHEVSGAARPTAVRPQHVYYAFLSYSHKDHEMADWLHRELEHFQVPRSLAGKLTTNGVIPRRLTPVFRDRQELAAADDLGIEIRESLAASRFLIVLCSPDAAKSRWTNAEIETFKRVRREGCVLAAIVGGEPFASDIPGREGDECFPPALRHRYDRRGRATTKRAEPIAADFREGKDGRRLAFLKLVAGMLGVGLDDLVQRENTRRQRRLALLAAASLAGMAVTSSLAVFAFQSRDEARDQRREAEGLVGFMLGDLKEKLEPIGRLDALDSVGSRALAYFEKQDKSELSDEALVQRARALTLIGEIANTRGDLNGALKRYKEALASTAESARRYPDDPARLFDHAQNVFWVGYIAWQRGQTAEAANKFREYQQLADRMVELAPGKNEYRLEQVYARSNLGTVLIDERRYREAARTFSASQGVAESLAAAEPSNLDHQKQVSNNLAWLAEAHEFSGALEQALADRERQLRLLADLERLDPRDTLIQRDTMTARRAMGRLLASRGDVVGGLRESEAAVTLAERLYRIEPENTEWLQWNAEARLDLANLELAIGRTASAAAGARAGCDIVDRLASRNTSVADWKARLSVKCLALRARVALAEHAPGEALLLARQAIAAARTSPRPIERALLVSRGLAIGGNAFAAQRDPVNARKWWLASLAGLPRSAELRPAEIAQVAVVHQRLGNRAEAQRLTATLTGMGYRYPSNPVSI